VARDAGSDLRGRLKIAKKLSNLRGAVHFCRETEVHYILLSCRLDTLVGQYRDDQSYPSHNIPVPLSHADSACFRHRTQVLIQHLVVPQRRATRCGSGSVFARMFYATSCGILADNPYRLGCPGSVSLNLLSWARVNFEALDCNSTRVH